jgi:hypothetical protein
MNPLDHDPLALKRLLVPAPDDARIATLASPLGNSVKNDPDCVESSKVTVRLAAVPILRR